MPRHPLSSPVCGAEVELPTGARVPPHHLRVRERAGRARDPVEVCSSRATSSRSTRARSSGAGMATRRSPSSSPTRRGRSSLRAARDCREVTEQSLWAGIAALANASRAGEIGDAVQTRSTHGGRATASSATMSGTASGARCTKRPTVFDYRVADPGPEVKPGLVVAIEPMWWSPAQETFVEEDDWTVSTMDGSAGSHWEHSVAVHDEGIWVLTAPDGGAAGLAPFGIVPARDPMRGSMAAEGKTNWFAIWISVAVLVVLVAGDRAGRVDEQRPRATPGRPACGRASTPRPARSSSATAADIDTYIDFMCPVCDQFEEAVRREDPGPRG